MTKKPNDASGKKKTRQTVRKKQEPKIIAQKGGVVVITKNVEGSNLVIGDKNLLNAQERKVSKPSKPPVLSTDEIPPAGDLPPGSHLPFPPNPLFTGREAVMKKLADALTPNPSPKGGRGEAVVITQAVTGMGGLGKTQLAIEFGHRYGRYFRGVHWLNLADPMQLEAEIAACGRQMFPAGYPDDQPSQVALTLNAWKADGPRLVILDNFEEPSLAGDVLARLRHSNIRVLVTSRRTDWTPATGLSSIPLNVFTEEESLAYLERSMSGRKDSGDDLKTLAERLGHLPLGLELASRYLNGHPRLSIAEYLKQARQALEHPSMKDWRADLPAATKHDLDLQRTFALSWQGLSRGSSAKESKSETRGGLDTVSADAPTYSTAEETAQKIFMLSGFLAPNTPIPLEIFEKTLEISPETCDEALTLLYGLGLLTKDEGGLPAMHPLLAEYACHLAKDDKTLLETLAGAIGILSNEAIQTGLPARFTPLRGHLPVLAAHAGMASLKSAGTLWNNYGYHLKEIADYAGARQAFERSLKIDEAAFGPDHPNVATDVNNLGSVLQDLGDLPAAREMYERALKIFENHLGENHSNVASIVNNLGAVLQDLGDPGAAREMFERSLKIDEAAFGPDHPKVARDVNNLGLVLKDLGDLGAAREMYERALKIDEAAFGPDHPNAAIRVNNLGLVLQDLGDLPAAREMFERALKIDEAAFGPDHPNVATLVNNLVSVLQDLGDPGAAREMFERALVILKKFLPPDHPNIKTVQENLDSLEE
ncbi:tetratricopeptide repeat protein [Chloroflexi bacterium CFX2]|nr:tetratricopeptide repeat protein [Chloroflexi bacterium CFX2]